MSELAFFIDHSRCIECEACMAACDARDTHGGKERCGGCSSCVDACRFDVPKYITSLNRTMNCDLCYDRRSVGKTPMCAAVCPTGALTFTTLDEIRRTRQTTPFNRWQLGAKELKTKIYKLVRAPGKRDAEQVAWAAGSPFDEPADVGALLDATAAGTPLAIDCGEIR